MREDEREDDEPCHRCGRAQGSMVWTTEGWVHDLCGDPEDIVAGLHRDLMGVFIECLAPSSPLSRATFEPLLERYARACYNAGMVAGKEHSAKALRNLILDAR